MNARSLVGWLLALGAIVGVLLLWFRGDALQPWQVQATAISLGYVFLVSTSGHLVDFVLDWASDAEKRRAADDTSTADTAADGGIEDAVDRMDGTATDGAETDGRDEVVEAGEDETKPSTTDEVTQADRDVGTIVGKSENVLLLTFILAEAYTALAVVFAAKGLVRREDIEKNTLYYLAGTLTNVTYSVVVGVGVRVLLVALGAGDVAFLNAPSP